MDYHRSPFREKQSNYDVNLTPKRAAFRNQNNFHNDRQNSNRHQINLNRKSQSTFRNTFLQGNSKHITSQMINEYDNQFSDKPERSYKRQPVFDAEIDSHHKSTFEENKKLNAKHFEIESKLNKIQSFHQKIQTLLDMVNKKPKTPSKNSDFHNSFTPQKTPTHQLSSRSVNKISPLNLKQKLEVQQRGIDAVSRQLNERRQIRQQKYGEQNQSSHSNNHHKNSMDQYEQITSNQPQEFWTNGRATSKFNDGKIVKRGQNQFKRQSKYFAKQNKGPLIRASEQFKESNRKKSKEYMKSIEGEVRDIQNTIELLNHKIRQVDTISSFKKQIVFDNLSTSNPESLSENQERVGSEMQKNYKASRTPARSYKQNEVKNSPHSNFMKLREGQSRNENSSYKNERIFRKTSINVMGTPSIKDNQLEAQDTRKQESQFRRQGLKISNPYDGDVEQSEQRNRYTILETRAKRN